MVKTHGSDENEILIIPEKLFNTFLGPAATALCRKTKKTPPRGAALTRPTGKNQPPERKRSRARSRVCFSSAESDWNPRAEILSNMRSIS